MKDFDPTCLVLPSACHFMMIFSLNGSEHVLAYNMSQRIKS